MFKLGRVARQLSLHGKCSKLVLLFNEKYYDLIRNSGRCKQLWKLMIKYEALRDEVEALYKLNLDYSGKESCAIQDAFKKRRGDEAEKFISKMRVQFVECLEFIGEYASYLTTETEFKSGMNWSEKYEKFASWCKRLADEIERLLDSWMHFLGDDLRQQRRNIELVRKGVDERIISAVQTREKKKDIPIYLEKLRDVINQKDKEFKKNADQVKYFYIIAKDINDALNSAELNALLNLVLTRAQQFDIPIEWEQGEIPPGFQQLGPFTILTVEDEAEIETMDFSDVKEERFLYRQKKTWLAKLSEQDLENGEFDPRKVFQNGADNYLQKMVEEVATGVTSPLAEISIKDPATFDAIKIPRNAKYYCFVYPMLSEIEKDDEKTPLDLVRLYGGYAYFDEDYHCLRLNGLIYSEEYYAMLEKSGQMPIDQKGENMYFAGPFLLDSRTKMSDGRFRDITIKALRDEGATKFAWYRPSELGERNNGCFVYYYPKSNKYTYFNLVKINIGIALKQIQRVQESDQYYTTKMYVNKIVSSLATQGKEDE